MRYGALLGFARKCKRSASCAAGSPAGGSRRSQGGHQCGIDCKLRATPKCKSVSDDLDAALILAGDINVEIPKPDVEGNRGSGLPANAGGRALERPTPGTEDA